MIRMVGTEKGARLRIGSGVVLVDRLPDLALVRAAERQLAGEELVEDHADGPDVGAVVDRFAAICSIAIYA
jgi:hypothetical protein